jgi:hypothetical protein
MSAGCESYKADNGVYPTNTSTTDNLDPRSNGDPRTTAYRSTSLDLYKLLSGDTTASRSPTNKSYMQFKPNMLFPADQTQPVQYIQDPFGNSYGYSTAQAANPGSIMGYNPTFDLWTTASLTTNPQSTGTDTITPQWVKNW